MAPCGRCRGGVSTEEGAHSAWDGARRSVRKRLPFVRPSRMLYDFQVRSEVRCSGGCVRARRRQRQARPMLAEASAPSQNRAENADLENRRPYGPTGLFIYLLSGSAGNHLDADVR